MAINRLWQSGFESGHINEFPNGVRGSPTVGVTRKTGSYGLSIPNSSAPQAGLVVIPGTRQIRCAWWGYHDMRPQDSMSSIWGIENSGGTVLASVDIEGTNNGGKMRVDANSLVDNSSANIYTPVGWYHWGVDIKIDSSAGWMNLYKDGILVASVSGNTGNSDIVTVYFGTKEARVEVSTYMDDTYLDDSTGEGAAAVCAVLNFYHVVPNGAGNYTQWDPSAGANWDAVEEVPPSTAEYVYTSTVDEFDSYTMSTFTIPSGSAIDAIIPIAYGKRDSTTEQLAIGTRYSGTDSVGSDQDLSAGTESFLWERQTTRPGGGSWDQTSLDGFEAIIKSRGSF